MSIQISSNSSIQLTTDEMNELDAIEKSHNTSTSQTASWQQIKERLLSKLQQ